MIGRWFERQVFGVCAIVMALAGCGGGGSGDAVSGDSGAGGGGAVGTTPTPGTAPQVPAPAVAGPTGWLWHSNYAFEYEDGVFMASLDGMQPNQILPNSNEEIAIWPDGRQYATTHWNIGEGSTDIKVVDRITGRTLYAVSGAGLIRQIEPSPTDKRLVKLIQGEDTISPFVEYIADLETLASRREIRADDWFAWMPDGRFLLVNPTAGTIKVGTVDSTEETLIGQFTLPPDRAMGPLVVSPTGKQFVIRLARISGTRSTDFWIANIDGSGLEQLTDTSMSYSAVWSPDGRYIAYDVDSGHVCSGYFCRGSCELRYTSADLRKVQGLDNTPGSSTFRVKKREGWDDPLGCNLLAWTPS